MLAGIVNRHHQRHMANGPPEHNHPRSRVFLEVDDVVVPVAELPAELAVDAQVARVADAIRPEAMDRFAAFQGLQQRRIAPPQGILAAVEVHVAMLRQRIGQRDRILVTAECDHAHSHVCSRKIPRAAGPRRAPLEFLAAAEPSPTAAGRSKSTPSLITNAMLKTTKMAGSPKRKRDSKSMFVASSTKSASAKASLTWPLCRNRRR